MVYQHQPSVTNSWKPPFKTKTQFITDNPAFTMGGLNWAIFNLRDELEEAQAIAYFGTKVIIHNDNMNQYVLKGGTKVIGGYRNVA